MSDSGTEHGVGMHAGIGLAKGSTISPAEPTALALSPGQPTAIEKMLGGAGVGAAAVAAGVTRMTICRWLKHDAKLQAAFNAWQQDALLDARTKLLAMADAAVNTVGGALQHDARLAFSFLKALGTLDRSTPGATDPDEVEQRMKIERARSDAKLGEDLFFASLNSGFNSLPPLKRSRPRKGAKVHGKK